MQKANNRTTDTAPDVEQASGNEPMAADGCAEFNSLVRIHVHSIRKRLADPDGVSAKAAIDGLVIGKILPNDTAKEVQEITFSQCKGKTEKTIITIEEVS